MCTKLASRSTVLTDWYKLNYYYLYRLRTIQIPDFFPQCILTGRQHSLLCRCVRFVLFSWHNLQLHWQHCTWLNTSMPTVAELGIWCYRTRRGDHALWWISQHISATSHEFCAKARYTLSLHVYAIYVYVHNSLVLRLFDYRPKYNIHCNILRFSISRKAKAVSNYHEA